MSDLPVSKVLQAETLVLRRYELALQIVLAPQRRHGSLGEGPSTRTGHITLTSQGIQLVLEAGGNRDPSALRRGNDWLVVGSRSTDNSHWLSLVELSFRLRRFGYIRETKARDALYYGLDLMKSESELRGHVGLYWYGLPTRIALAEARSQSAEADAALRDFKFGRLVQMLVDESVFLRNDCDCVRQTELDESDDVVLIASTYRGKRTDAGTSLSSADAQGEDLTDYGWYVAMKEAMPMRSAGVGLGLERFPCWLTENRSVMEFASYGYSRGLTLS